MLTIFGLSINDPVFHRPSDMLGRIIGLTEWNATVLLEDGTTEDIHAYEIDEKLEAC
jgi:hypothetical protein